MKTYSITIFAACLFYSCSNSTQNTSMNNDSIPVKETKLANHPDNDSLINRAMNFNDSQAYNEVASRYLLSNMGQDFFYFALRMAYKNNSAEAYYHVYDIIAYPSPKDSKEYILNMESKTRDFALFHLLRSYEMGYERSKYEIHKLFGKDKIPQSSTYIEKYCSE
jgi:hypothetical protein